MARSKKIATLMHNLLIDKEIDGFTVVELRDASMKIDDAFTDSDDARRKMYRQILSYTKKGWLISKGSGQQKRYFQTELFKKFNKTTNADNHESMTNSVQEYAVLIHERSQYQGELEIVLGEIEEYQSLNHRFPELKRRLIPLLENSKERSAYLLGKVNVLTNVLKIISEGNSTC